MGSVLFESCLVTCLVDDLETDKQPDLSDPTKKVNF